MSWTLAAAVVLLGLLVGLALAQFWADSPEPFARRLRPVASPTLRGGVARSLIALAVIPALALVILAGGERADDRVRSDLDLVAHSANDTAVRLDAYVARHVAGVRGAARTIMLDGRLDAPRIGEWLLRFHPIYTDFQSMLVAGPQGEVLVATHRRNGELTIVAKRGISVADRAYFRVPKLTGAEVVSDGFRGRGLGTDPLIAISAPIVIDGEPWGVVEGSLDLGAFTRFDASVAEMAGGHLVLTDANGTILYAHPTSGLSVLDPLRSAPLGRVLDELGATAEATLAGGTVLVGHARTANGWHVLVTKPRLTALAMIAIIGWLSAAWLAVCALTAGGLAFVLARRISRPMRGLESTLAAYRPGDRSPFARLAGLPLEYRYVYRQLHRLVVRLANRHRRLADALRRALGLEQELRTVIAEREREIAARTADLAAANRRLEDGNRALKASDEHFRALAECAGIGILVHDADGVRRYANAQWHEIAGQPPDDDPRAWQRVLDPAEVATLRARLASGRGDEGLARVTRPDGGVRWVQRRSVVIHTEYSSQPCLLCTFEDVTELVESRQTIRDLAHRLESVKEEERRALARTLHEEIAQDLYAAKLALLQLRRLPGGSADHAKREADVDAMIDDVLRSLRDVTNELRPSGLERLAIADVLRWHAGRTEQITGLTIDVEEIAEAGAAPASLSETERLALFRAAQEALTNVVKHAGATRAGITLRWAEDEVILEVADDGASPDVPDAARPPGFGLLRLRERLGRVSGSVSLTSRPGAGALFTARLPLRSPTAADEPTERTAAELDARV